VIPRILPSSKSFETVKPFFKKNSKGKKMKGFHDYFSLQTYYAKPKENEFSNAFTS
jgi:hypothetical protein